MALRVVCEGNGPRPSLATRHGLTVFEMATRFAIRTTEGPVRPFATCIVACTILSALAGCSSDDPDTTSVFQMGPAPGPALQPGRTTNQPGPSPTTTEPPNPVKPPATGPTGTNGPGEMPGPMADAGPTGDMGDGGTDDGAVPAEPLDCTPVEWANPGGVKNPTLEFAGEDDGKLFAQKAALEDYDYVLEEYFFSGTSPGYTSRMVVKRPSDPAKFSGTVYVEWFNVSGGIDMAVMWADSREYFMREGHVFVGVSAQAAGVNALKSNENVGPRYQKLNHPGDAQAAEIFSQAGVAIRTQTDMLLGECMPVHAVLGIGQSQSSFRLAGYVNDTHPSAQVYDGFLLHSGREPATNDPGVPTLGVFTTTEGNATLDDGPSYVKWNVAGATHNGERVTTRGGEGAVVIGLDANALVKCTNPLNQYPSYRVYNAALDWLHRWVRDDERPPAGPRFETSGSALALDAHGNVKGGVRLPDIDVPIATYNTDNGPENAFDFISALACGLGGNTVYFSNAELMGLYPTHDDYVEKYTAAADEALGGGFLLQADYDEAVAEAEAADVP